MRRHGRSLSFRPDYAAYFKREEILLRAEELVTREAVVGWLTLRQLSMGQAYYLTRDGQTLLPPLVASGHIVAGANQRLVYAAY